MVRQYRKFDEDFKAGAVRLVFGTGKPIARTLLTLGGARAVPVDCGIPMAAGAGRPA
jgi:transposase-like protein